MPVLESLISRSVIGNLSGVRPLLPHVTATTLTTGVGPDRHDILTRLIPDASSELGVRYVSSKDVRAPTLWQYAAAAGLDAACVGWPVTHPAMDSRALVVSGAFGWHGNHPVDDWRLPEHTISQRSHEEALSEFRFHPSEITADMLLPFLEDPATIDTETDERPGLLGSALARASSCHAAATWIAEHGDHQLLMVHNDFIERVSDRFIHYRAPQLGSITDADFARYQHVAEGAYRFCDMMLASYLDLIDDDTYVFIVSGHGYTSGNERSRLADTGALYREFGVLLASGPGLKQDELIFGAQLTDIAPTLLALLGLPVSANMQGQLLTDLFVDEAPEIVTGDAEYELGVMPVNVNTPVADAVFDAEDEDDSSLDVESLSAEVRADRSRVLRFLTLARYHHVQKENDKALDALAALFEIHPDHESGRLLQAQCLFALKQDDACREALEYLVNIGSHGPALDFLYGQLLLRLGDEDQAQVHLAEAEAGGVGHRGLVHQIGRVHLNSQSWQDAERAFRSALEIDPDFAAAYTGLGAALVGQERPVEAAEYLRTSISLLHLQADAHFLLGTCYSALERRTEAVASLRQASKIAPDQQYIKDALSRAERRLVKSMAESAEEQGD